MPYIQVALLVVKIKKMEEEIKKIDMAKRTTMRYV
jgi:hypothetical protein